MPEILQPSGETPPRRRAAPARSRSASGGPERTRRQLLDAAERLMAERGIEAVSLREIAAAASARSSSAGQYHFGTKEHLVEAVLERHMDVINRRRLYLLAEVRGTDGGTDGDGDRGLRPYVEAFVHPLVEHIGEEAGSSWYGRFLARYISSRGMAPTIDSLENDSTSGLRLVYDEIGRRLVGVPEVLRRQRIRMGNTLVIHTLAEFERDRDTGRVWTGGRSLLASSLVDTTLAVLDAPVSATTGALASGTGTAPRPRSGNPHPTAAPRGAAP